MLVFAADLLYYVPALAGNPVVEIWSDSIWLAAYVLIAAAGAHPGERRGSNLTRSVEHAPLRRLRFVGIALLVMPAMFAVEQLAGSGKTDWRAAVAINASVAVLVVLRLRILLSQVDRARGEASTAQNRFETVFETAGLGISITEEGKLIRSNPAFQKLIGYTSEELATMSVSDDRPSGRLRRSSSSTRRSTEITQSSSDASSGVTGTSCTSTSTSPSPPGTGMSIAVIEDVTGRKELEEQVREAQKIEAVGRLAGGIAHDFNNILTVVSGHTELLRDQLTEDAEADIETILDSVRRANDLTRQLLTFSRREEPSTAVIEPADIFRDTEILIRNVVGGSVSLEVRIEDSSPRGGRRSRPARVRSCSTSPSTRATRCRTAGA